MLFQPSVLSWQAVARCLMTGSVLQAVILRCVLRRCSAHDCPAVLLWQVVPRILVQIGAS